MVGMVTMKKYYPSIGVIIFCVLLFIIPTSAYFEKIFSQGLGDGLKYIYILPLFFIISLLSIGTHFVMDIQGIRIRILFIGFSMIPYDRIFKAERFAGPIHWFAYIHASGNMQVLHFFISRRNVIEMCKIIHEKNPKCQFDKGVIKALKKRYDIDIM
jgi:hypothetical protein